MVAFGMYQFYLHFEDHIEYVLPEDFDFIVPAFPSNDKQIMITVHGRFSHRRTEDSEEKSIDFPLQESDLLQLLEHKISKASLDDDGSLILKFDHGHVLKCFNDPAYESFYIRFGGYEMII